METPIKSAKIAQAEYREAIISDYYFETPSRNTADKIADEIKIPRECVEFLDGNTLKITENDETIYFPFHSG